MLLSFVWPPIRSMENLSRPWYMGAGCIWANGPTCYDLFCSARGGNWPGAGLSRPRFPSSGAEGAADPGSRASMRRCVRAIGGPTRNALNDLASPSDAESRAAQISAAEATLSFIVQHPANPSRSREMRVGCDAGCRRDAPNGG
jgi:hypothetical protein